MTQPLLSIIIVTFNAGKTLQRALDSIFQQSFGDFEIVAVDGNSSDETVTILEKINDLRLKYISEPDLGIYDAMNKGIDRATGQWVYFLGGDDQFYNNDILGSIFDEIDFKNIEFIYGNVKSAVFKGVYDGEFDYNKLLKKNISHQSIFYHKKIFQKIGKFNLNYKMHADWDFNLRCFESKQISIKYVDKIIARFGEGGVSSNYDLPFLRESLLPRKLKFLQTEKSNLFNLKNYDEWWRFIRNAGLRSENDFIKSGYILQIPEAILSMVNMQNKLSQSLLRKGIFSKMFMSISYLLSSHNIRN